MRRQLSSIVLSTGSPVAPRSRYFMSQICCEIAATVTIRGAFCRKPVRQIMARAFSPRKVLFLFHIPSAALVSRGAEAAAPPRSRYAGPDNAGPGECPYSLKQILGGE